MKTFLLITPCYDEPHRTMGSAPKIARQLAKKSRVIVFTGGSNTKVEQRGKNLTVHFVKELLIPDPVNNAIVPGMIKSLKKILRKERIDAVINLKYMFYPNLCALYLIHKGYYVITLTDAFPGYSWFSASKIVNAVMWVYTRTIGLLILRRSKKVFLFHQGLVKDAKRLGLNYKVVPNGVEYEIINKAKKKRLAGKINLLYVGRLESVKGYETLLLAASKVTAKHKKIHFYHIGDLRGKKPIVEKFSNEQMHFEGRKKLSEVYSYMKGADIILLGSKSEGLPNAIMEGMACGCVPVSTPVGAVPYLLEGDKLGRTFPYKDTSLCVRAIEELISDNKKLSVLKRKVKKKISAEYDWSKLIDLYMEELCAE